ncbi:MAG: ATP-binding protein [Pseudohongiellaceae bacterium]
MSVLEKISLEQSDSAKPERFAVPDKLKLNWLKFLFGSPADLWKRNFFAVAIVITFLTVSYYVDLKAYEAATGYEEAINISGRQRMLSQRALYLAVELKNGSADAKLKLLATIREFDQANEALATSSHSKSLKALPPEINRHYWGHSESPGLYQKSNDFITDVFNFSESSPPDTALWRKVNAYETDQLLESLDQAVQLFEDRALKQTEILINGQKYSMIFGSLMLIIMAVFIFWPSQLAINTNFKKLETNNKKLTKHKKRALKLANKAEKHARIAEQQRDKALEAERLKSEFLTIMGHEIRTPLNGILGMLELLSMDTLTDEQERRISTANISAKALLRIINDILDYSKLEHNRMPVIHTKFDIRQLTHQTFEIYETVAAARENVLSVNVESDVPLVFVSDRERVSQVLHNLLDNAIKFTYAGTISLNVSLIDIDQTVCLHFEVIDTGIGIGEEDHHRIFHRFTQVESELNRSYSGNGLGLPISKKIIELLGGDIEFESETDCGSIFRFWVPLGDTKSKSSPSDAEEKPSENSKVFNVLVVEDNKTNQMLIKSMLTKIGHKVSIAENGLAALESINDNDFDVVLMDIQMPIMDGIEATQKIRKLPNKKSQLPIYAVTANSDGLNQTEQGRIGLNGCLPKPVSLQSLTRLLQLANCH